MNDIDMPGRFELSGTARIALMELIEERERINKEQNQRWRDRVVGIASALEIPKGYRFNLDVWAFVPPDNGEEEVIIASNLPESDSVESIEEVGVNG